MAFGFSSITLSFLEFRIRGDDRRIAGDGGFAELLLLGVSFPFLVSLNGCQRLLVIATDLWTVCFGLSTIVAAGKFLERVALTWEIKAVDLIADILPALFGGLYGILSDLSSKSSTFSPRNRGAAVRLARFDDGFGDGEDIDLFLLDPGVSGDKTFALLDFDSGDKLFFFVCVAEVTAVPFRFLGCLAIGPEVAFLPVLVKKSRFNVESEDADERVVGVVSVRRARRGGGVERFFDPFGLPRFRG